MLDQIQSDDPSEICKDLKKNEIGILNDYINMWTRAINELLDKLRDTIPGEGMIGEVHYWRDLSFVLDGLASEVKQP